MRASSRCAVGVHACLEATRGPVEVRRDLCSLSPGDVRAPRTTSRLGHWDVDVEDVAQLHVVVLTARSRRRTSVTEHGRMNRPPIDAERLQSLPSRNMADEPDHAERVHSLPSRNMAQLSWFAGRPRSLELLPRLRTPRAPDGHSVTDARHWPTQCTTRGHASPPRRTHRSRVARECGHSVTLL